MSSKGQITIPRSARKALGIEPGDRVSFEVRGDELILKRIPAKIDWRACIGLLADGRTTDQVMRELRPVRAWDEQ